MPTRSVKFNVTHQVLHSAPQFRPEFSFIHFHSPFSFLQSSRPIWPAFTSHGRHSGRPAALAGPDLQVANCLVAVVKQIVVHLFHSHFYLSLLVTFWGHAARSRTLSPHTLQVRNGQSLGYGWYSCWLKNRHPEHLATRLLSSCSFFSACFATTSKILSTCSMGFLLFFRMGMSRKIVADINQDFVAFLIHLLDPFAQHSNGVIVDLPSFMILPFIVDFLDSADSH